MYTPVPRQRLLAHLPCTVLPHVLGRPGFAHVQLDFLEGAHLGAAGAVVKAVERVHVLEGAVQVVECHLGNL